MRRVALFLTLGWLSWASAADADKTATKAAADALFREAVSLGDRGELAQSVEKFRASYELDPARGTLQGWAMAEERLGRVLDAYTRFQRLLEVASQANDGARANYARERLAVLKVRVPTLTIELGGDVPRGTKVTLDDDALPAGAAGSALPINPGDHLVIAIAPDGRRFSRMIGVSEGARARLRVTWTEPQPASEPGRVEKARAAEQTPPSPYIGPGLIVGAGGLVLAGVGTYLWIDAGKDYDAVDESCPNKQCPASAQDQIDRGRRKETWSQVLWVAGGLAMATGVTLVVVGRSGSTEARVSMSPNGLYLHGRF